MGNNIKSEVKLNSYKRELHNRTFVFKVGSFNNVGGAETKALTVAQILKEQVEANVIFMGNGGNGDLKKRLDDLGIPTVIFPYKYHIKGRIAKAIQIIKQILFLRKLKPDFILPWSSDNCKSILPYWKLTGAKYAWWNMQDEGRGLYKTKNEERLLLEASDIISNSLAGELFLRENYNLNGKEIIRYNNPTEIPNTTNSNFSWRKKIGIDEQTLLVSMFANITKWKDHKTLFKAWRLVLDHFEKKQVPIKLVLAGACRETTNELKVLGFDLKIAHTVEFIGSINTVNELILESDLVVHSSNTEGCPNAVCEAMALAKAVVATDIPGDREALTDKYEQYTLSMANTPESLASKIIYLLENEQLRAEIAQFNKKRIETDYTLEGMIDTLFPRFVKALES